MLSNYQIFLVNVNYIIIDQNFGEANTKIAREKQ